MYRNNSSGLQIVEIELTNKCNLSCKHCYVDKNKKCDLSYDDAISIINQSNSLGVNRIIFTGGEPLLYKDLFRVAMYAKKLNIPEVMLMTNSILISEENLDKLKIFDLIQISIDVPPGEKHHFRTDYTDMLKENILLMKSYDIEILLFATLYKSLLPLIDKLIEFANSLNVRIAFNKLSTNNKHIKDECLNISEIYYSFKKISSSRKNFSIGCSDPFLFLIDDDRMNSLRSINKNGVKGGCMAGIAALYFASNGDVYSCPFVNLIISNIKTKSIKEIWLHNSTLNQLRNRNDYTGYCGECEYIDFCGGCRASSYNSTGNLLGEDPNCIKFFIEEKSKYS